MHEDEDHRVRHPVYDHYTDEGDMSTLSDRELSIVGGILVGIMVAAFTFAYLTGTL